MIRFIKENLARQVKGFKLLQLLLEEEFSRLTQRDPQGVSSIEMPIQELLRQIGAERISLKSLLAGAYPETRLRDFPAALGGEEGLAAGETLQAIKQAEQQCARQAAKNQRLAAALSKQSQNLLEFLHNSVRPKNNGAYSAKGCYAKAPSRPSLLSGRL
ncbi:MAG: flagellar export chaperone FlgN [Desulfovibrionaceae bacterium]